MSGRNERTVPRSTTSCGMTFHVSPPCTCVTLTTPASSGWMLRATIVCSALITCAANGIGSRPRCGIAAWPPRPVATISKMSYAPISGPSRNAIAADGKLRPVVHAVHGLHRKAVEQALLHHDAAAALVLLGGLEDEVRRAVEALALRHRARRAEEHRRVAVVAARVHLAFVLRRVRDAGLLVDVQRVEVRAQADRILRSAVPQHADHAGAGEARCALRARMRAACPRRTRPSPSPRTRSRDARGCGDAMSACRRRARRFRAGGSCAGFREGCCASRST